MWNVSAPSRFALLRYRQPTSGPRLPRVAADHGGGEPNLQVTSLRRVAPRCSAINNRRRVRACRESRRTMAWGPRCTRRRFLVEHLCAESLRVASLSTTEVGSAFAASRGGPWRKRAQFAGHVSARRYAYSRFAPAPLRTTEVGSALGRESRRTVAGASPICRSHLCATLRLQLLRAGREMGRTMEGELCLRAVVVRCRASIRGGSCRASRRQPRGGRRYRSHQNGGGSLPGTASCSHPDRSVRDRPGQSCCRWW